MPEACPKLAALSCRLAAKDWLHEFGLSFCGILALASILAPLLVLHGAHMGVVERLRQNLMADPAVLVIVPQGSRGAGFNDAFIEKIRALPGIRYAIGRSRDVAAELQLTSAAGKRLTIPLDATSAGDPVRENFDAAMPVSRPAMLEITLTASAAKKLQASVGEILESSLVRRRTSGALERTPIRLRVASILPVKASGRDAALVDLPTLMAIQNVRDGVSAPLLGYTGEFKIEPEARYESFRAYANGLDDVEPLARWFEGQDVEVKTRARDIANIRSIDRTLGAVITLIAAAGISGFFAFMASTSEASVRRKWKQIGMLRLTGFSKAAILAFPLTQALLTGVAGCLLAYIVYGIVAYSIDAMFSAQTGGESICSLPFIFILLSFIFVQLLALLASGWSALKASAISPSAVIRQT